ncbi:MAG: mechanosensitive ion channel family protein [Bacteroidales bacterium]
MSLFLSLGAAAENVAASDTTKHVATGLAKAIENSTFQDIMKQLIAFSVNQSLKILAAIVIYFVGKWIINRIKFISRKVMEKREVDHSLRSFLLNLINITLTILLFVIIIGVLGVETTSMAALLASAGVGIGMAMSGTLQNFAGGVIILLLKPYKVGDFIEAQGQLGTVREILIFNTVLNTIDNKVIYIPNGSLSSGIINNYSQSGIRRVDLKFGFAYGDSYDEARKMILGFLEGDDRILTTPAEPFIGLHTLNNSSIDIVVRIWTRTENYWNLYFELTEKVYKNYPAHGLNIPFPQMDVHMYPTNTNTKA